MAYYGYPYNNMMAPQNPPLPSFYAQPVNQYMIQVQGEGAAKAYNVAPGNTVPLWDSESQTIYVKSVDASGFPTMRILDYTIRDPNRENDPLKALILRVEALEQRIGGMANESAVSTASAGSAAPTAG